MVFVNQQKLLIGVGTPIIGMKYIGVVERHCCCMETPSSNCWTCSWLPALWIVVTYGWVNVCGVIWWMVEVLVVSFCIAGLATTWCCSLAFNLCVGSMFGAFIGSFPMGYTCCLSCIWTCSETSWCVSYLNYFIKLLVTILNIFWNQKVLEKVLHYFLR